MIRRMGTLQILQLVLSVVNLLKQSGFLQNGKLTLDLNNLQSDVSFVSGLEDVLNKSGVKLPGVSSSVLNLAQELVK